MDTRSPSVAQATREEQRLLLRQFAEYYDEVDAGRSDEAIIEAFLDGNGVEHRAMLSRVEAELAPAVDILRRNRGRDLPSIAMEGISVRIQTALKLLKGEL